MCPTFSRSCCHHSSRPGRFIVSQALNLRCRCYLLGAHWAIPTTSSRCETLLVASNQIFGLLPSQRIDRQIWSPGQLCLDRVIVYCSGRWPIAFQAGLKRALYFVQVFSKVNDEKAPMCSGSLGRGARGEHCRGCSGLWTSWTSSDGGFEERMDVKREMAVRDPIRARDREVDEPEREGGERKVHAGSCARSDENQRR
jgi:hypothetical protein